MHAPSTTAGKLLPAGVALALLIVVGSVGFHVAFHSPWVVGVYQMLVTVSTLGDARVTPTTPAQYVLIAGLIVLGYLVWAFVVAVVAGTLISTDLRALWGGQSVADRIAALRGHTIVVGAGRVGRQVATELRRAGREVVVIERDPEQTASLAAEGFLTLARDALGEGALEEAGIARASGVVLALPDDAQNLYVLLAVRDVAPNAFVVARAETARAERHLRALGVQRVVMPTALGGMRMARLMVYPLSTDFLDTIVDRGELDVREQPVGPGDPLEGLAVREIRLRLGEGVTLLAIHRDGRTLPLPPANDRIAAGDTLLLVTVGSARRQA